MITVAAYVGSLRRGSHNRRLVMALERLSDGRLKMVHADLGAVPFYNEDLTADWPAAAKALKAVTERADAILFAMPEYNRFPPSSIVNATEWGSRPRGKSSFVNRPAAIVGTSPGAIGTAAGQVAMRSLAVGLGLVVMGHPEVYLQMKPGLIDEDGRVTDAGTETFLRGWVDAFVAFVDRVGVRQAVAAG